MNLVIDIGNTLTKLALFEGSRLIKLISQPMISEDELKGILKQYQPGSAIISSVREQDSIIGILEDGLSVIKLTVDTAVPIRNNYQTPWTLGSDRLAAAVAAHHTYGGKNVLVITCGSCITYDLVNRRGSYEGGAISPGMQMRFQAMNTFTGRLPLVTYQEDIPVVGQTTTASLQSGAVNGMASEIDGMIERYKEEYPDLIVILSGGDMIYFAKRLKNNIFALPNIVLEGLNIILNFNENLR